jgi:hypothetical protein
MKGAVPARSGCYACGQILLACGQNLLFPVERESGISAMFQSAGSRAPRLEADDEIIAHHRLAHYPGAFHPASAAPQLIPL